MSLLPKKSPHFAHRMNILYSVCGEDKHTHAHAHNVNDKSHIKLFNIYVPYANIMCVRNNRINNRFKENFE